MKRLLPRNFILISCSILFVGGCGTTVPSIGEAWDQGSPLFDSSGVLEDAIKDKVYCELKDAVLSVSPSEQFSIYRDNKPIEPLPDSWGVQVTMSLEVDEATNIAPSVTLNDPIRNSVKYFLGFGTTTNPQSFSVGVGATASSQSARTDKFSSFYSVKQLRTRLGRTDSCHFDDKGTPISKERRGSSFLITSDLGLTQWLSNAVIINNTHRSSSISSKADTAFKQDILSYEAKFVVKTEGTVSPVWKLVRLSSGQAGNLATANRIRTHDLLITFGPSNKADGKSGIQYEPSQRALNSHLASEIGLAVASNLRLLNQ